METASEMLEMAWKHGSEQLDDQDARHQATRSQLYLHQIIQVEGNTVMASDKEISRELLNRRNQYQEILQKDSQALREDLQELRESKEERRLQEGRLTELFELIVSLNIQVKGKGKQSDPTREKSPKAVGGGTSSNGSPPLQQGAPGAPGGGSSNDDKKKDPGKKDGMRNMQECSAQRS